MRSSKARNGVRLGILLMLMLGLVMPAVARQPATPQTDPTGLPTEVPTKTPPDPTAIPTDIPTEVPTEVPTEAPTETPEFTTNEEGGRSFNILAADPMTVVLDGPTSIRPGETLTYRVTMTNTRGEESLRMTILDYQLGLGTDWEIVSYSFQTCSTDGTTLGCQSDIVADGVELTVTYQSTIPDNPSSDLCANGFSNEVRALSFLTNNNYSDINSNTVTTDVVCETAEIDLAKTGSHIAPTIDTPYGAIDWALTVTNTGDAPLTDVTVSDDTVTDLDCDPATEGNQDTIATLAPGDANAVTCTASSAVTEDQLGTTVTNDASVTGFFGGEPVTDTASAQVEVPALTGGIDVTKAVTNQPEDGFDFEDTITYAIRITNTGDIPLHGVTVSDDQVTDLDCGTGTTGATVTLTHLEPGEANAVNCTASTAFPVPSGTDQDAAFTNTVSVSAPFGDATLTDTATAEAVPGETAIHVRYDRMPLEVIAPGQVTATHTLVNAGTTTLHDLTLTAPMPFDCDPGTPGDQGMPETLAAGGTVICIGTVNVSQADIDAGEEINPGDWTLTAFAFDTLSARIQWPIVQRPELTLVKSVEPIVVNARGDVTWSFVVTNSGNVTLTNLALEDDTIDPAALDCDTGAAGNQPLPESLAPQAEVNCAAVTTIDQEMIDAREPLTNTARVTSDEATSNDASATVTITPRDELGLVLSVTPGTVDAPAQVIWTYALTNGGTSTLTGIAIDDPALDPALLDCDPEADGLQSPSTTLEAGGSVTCTAVSTVDQTMIDTGDPITRDAVVTSAGANSNRSQATVTITQAPAVQLTKTVTPATVSATGDVTWSFEVTNTGNVTLTNLELDDSLVDPSTLDCDATTAGNQAFPATLAPGASITCAAITTISQDQVDAREPLTNTARITTDQATSNTASATVTITPDDGLGLTLTVDPGTVNAPGQVTWSYTLTNNGTSTLTAFEIDDPALDPALLDCDAGTDGRQPLPENLAPGASVTCTAPGNIGQADIDAGAPISREATATSADTTSNSSRATVTITQSPGIELTKTVTSEATTGLVNGDVVTYALVLTNTGNLTVSDPSITDPGGDTLDCGEVPAILAPGATVSCTATHTITELDMLRGEYTNIAEASAAVGQGPADGVLSFRQVEQLMVETTASATVTTASVEVGLTIEKSVSPAEPARAGTTLTYTFVVTNTGNVSLDDVTVGDPLPGLVWDTDHPNGLVGTLEARAAVTLTATYVVTTEDVAAGAVDNVADVTGVHPSCREDDDIPSVGECAVTSQTASVTVPAEPDPTSPPDPTTPADPSPTPAEPTTSPDPTTPAEPTSPPEATAEATESEVVTALPSTGGGSVPGTPAPGAILALLGLAIAALAGRKAVHRSR